MAFKLEVVCFLNEYRITELKPMYSLTLSCTVKTVFLRAGTLA